MSALPFLVVHGAVVGYVMIAALAAAAIALKRALRYRLQRRDDRGLVAVRASLAGKLAPGTVTLRGTLRGWATTLTELPFTLDARHARSGELAVVVGDELVELFGDVTVIAGS